MGNLLTIKLSSVVEFCMSGLSDDGVQWLYKGQVLVEVSYSSTYEVFHSFYLVLLLASFIHENGELTSGQHYLFERSNRGSTVYRKWNLSKVEIPSDNFLTDLLYHILAYASELLNKVFLISGFPTILISILISIFRVCHEGS